MPDQDQRESHSPVGGSAPELNRVDLTSDFSISMAAAAVSEAAPVSPALTHSARYELLDEIARGGMGIIWRATDTILSREVAVKVLQDKFSPDSGTARRFADEARITAKLQHPAIPPVHDYGKLPDERPFLAMKLIKGRTLEDLLRQRADPSANVHAHGDARPRALTAIFHFRRMALRNFNGSDDTPSRSQFRLNDANRPWPSHASDTSACQPASA